MKDRNKYNKFMKEVMNPAKFITGILELSKKDIKKLETLNSVTESLDDIFENILAREGDSKLADMFKLSKSTWSSVSDNSSSKKLIEVKLNTIMSLGDKYEKVISNNIDKINSEDSIRTLYLTKNKINDIHSEIRNVCSDKNTRTLIVDILKNLSVIILKAANNKKLVSTDNVPDDIDFNNRNHNILHDIIDEANKLNENETVVNINLGEDFEDKFNNAILIYKSFSNKIIATMNDVDAKLLDDYDVSDMEFKRNSILFKDGGSVSVTSNVFRARFSSLMLNYISKRMSKMALVLANEYDDKLISSLATLIKMSIEYTTSVLKNRKTDHYDMVKCLIGSKGNNKSMNNNIQTLNKLDEFITGLNSNLKGKDSKLEKELQMNYVIRIAYMMTSINDNATIDYPDDFDIKDKDDNLEVVKALGKAINKSNRKFGKLNKVFEIFNLSKSTLFVKFKNDDLDDDTVTGCRALAFVSFVLNDKKVNKIVDALVY